MRRELLVLVALTACGSSDASDGGSSSGTPPPANATTGPPKWMDVAGDRLGALPPPGNATTTRFATSDVCAQCHINVLDTKGRDVSAVATWKTSAMALAARDPYYLAAFADELAFRPALASTVEQTCTRCHSPAGSVELEGEGKSPTFAMLTTGADTSSAAHLSREGVACSLCHQIEPTNLGTYESFTGNFTVGDQRRIYGPYQDPATDPMRTLANYMPTYGDQQKQSALCATCHTVITKPRDARGYVGPDFPEQVPFLEWLASDFADGKTRAATCQDCHMRAADDDGATLDVPIAKIPNLNPRKPFWRHGFEGANVQLARWGASDPPWFGVALTKADHERQEQADEGTLRSAARLEVAAGGGAITVKVTNESGHKLPTGYPSRRIVLHVKITAPGGAVVWESGRLDEFGRIATGEPSTFFPHFDVVTKPEDVQIYESVPIDAKGKIAHRPLDSLKYGKDNRLLPSGFNPKSSFSAYIAPVGVGDDPGFGPTDTITYRPASVPAGSTVLVELLFQTTRPSDIEVYAAAPTPAARRLFDFAKAAPPLPVVIASATTTTP